MFKTELAKSNHGQSYGIDKNAQFVTGELERRTDTRVSDLGKMTPQQLRALVDRRKALELEAVTADRAKDELKKIMDEHLKISDSKLEVIKAGSKFIGNNNKQIADAMTVSAKAEDSAHTLYEQTTGKIGNIQKAGETQRATNREILAATLRSQINGIKGQVEVSKRTIQLQENKVNYERYINGETDEVPEMPTSSSDKAWSKPLSAFTSWFK